MQPVKRLTSLRIFLIVWVGQLTSTLGSEMTNFAVTIWAWELTGQATPLSLIYFFSRTPRVIAASFAGVFIDRWNRKLMMIGGDAAAGISTVFIILLLWTNRLEIWHLYVAAMINGFFGYIQGLAYSASMTMIVPKQHYARAGAMSFYISQFASDIMAPALAGGLYYLIGLSGIISIDVATCIIAICTVWVVHIPSPKPSEVVNQNSQTLWQRLTFGVRYIFKRRSLLAILIFLLSINLIETANSAIFSPLILARSGNDAAVLASVLSTAGIGGFVGAVLLSIWGGPKRRIHGLLLGAALSKISSIAIGLGRVPGVWMIAGFFEYFFSPFLGSSNQAIWLSKVEPDVQGRVFAARYLIAQITSPLGFAIAGPLADYVFEPAMMPSGSLAGIFGGIFGTGEGAGMALQYTLFAIFGVLVGLSGYAFRTLRDVEAIVPDHDVVAG